MKKSYFKEIVIGIFLALILLMVSQRFFIIGTIPSESMHPTLQVKDKIILKTNFTSIERGKIYAFKIGDVYLIKRCIALEDDHVQVINNDVYINEVKLQEEYVSSLVDENMKIDLDFIVPKGKVFFLGDNRGDSNDCRFLSEHYIDASSIAGLATYRIFPFNRIGCIED